MIHIVKATELPTVDELSLRAIQQMKQDGIPQWDERYPRAVHFLQDIRHASLFGLYENDQLLGVACIDQNYHESYQSLDWDLSDSIIVHRLVVDPLAQGQGVGQRLLRHAEELAKQKQARFVKIDTHQDNHKMIRLLEKLGYQKIGYLEAIHRIAYEKVV